MEKEELELLKKHIKELVEKQGYILFEDIGSVVLDDTTRPFFDWLDEEHIPITSREEAYLDSLKDNEDKILFCYYMFICHFLQKDVDIDSYDRLLVYDQKNVVDHYIKEECDDFEQTIIRLKYGLDSGTICPNEEKLFKLSEIPYLDAFVRYYSGAESKLSPDYRNHSFLANQLKEIKINSRLASYSCGDVEFDDNDKGIMFQPIRRGISKNNHYVGGFACYYPEDGARQIGWILEPNQFSQSITFYGDKVWGLRFYNKNKPSPHIHFEDGKLYFELYYSNLGYHGRRYIVESGKNVIVEEYKKGTKLSETELDFKIDANLYDMFSFPSFTQSKTEKIQFESGSMQFQTLEKFDGRRLAYRVSTYTGNSAIGMLGEGGFEGTVLTHRAHSNKYTYHNFVKGEEDPRKAILTINKDRYPQIMTLSFYNNNNKQCVFVYDPDSLSEGLIYAEYDNERNEPDNIANLSNPFFKKPIIKELKVDGSNDPEEALNSLIGLDSVKKQIMRLKALLHKDRAKNNPINLNMVFSGNPGTGKTVVARLLAAILFKEKILPSDKFVEVDRSMLVAKYVGQTENNVRDLIESAMGGVIFIDEAYALYSRWGEEGNDYGRNALDVFVKAMEDYRGKICFIFAGYKYPMMRMMDMNQGFKSRVNRFIDFPNYSIDELKLIAAKMSKDNEYELEDGVVDEIMRIIKPKMKDDDFANAREVRNILETLYEIQAVRTYENTSDMLIKLEDVKVYEEDIHFKDEADKEKPVINIFDIKKMQETLNNLVISDRYIQEASVNIKNIDNGQVISEGSGFFITPDGLIGTCAHVIKDTKDIKVNVNLFTDKGKRTTKSYDAIVVGFDEEADVGLIKIKEPDIDFSFYPLASRDCELRLLSPVVMGGYPLGGERFKTISINEGSIQSLNKDSRLEDEQSKIDRIYVDLTGHSGNSGSGLVSRELNKCIGVYAGGSLGYSGPVVMKLNYAIHIKYLWDLLEKLSNKDKEQ